LFKAVLPDRVGPLLQRLEPRTVAKGQILNTPGQTAGHLHLILRGYVKAYQVTIDGRELLLELIQSGGFDGILSVLGRQGHFTEAMEDSLILSIPRATLDRLLKADPTVCVNLLDLTVSRLDSREQHLEVVALRDPTLRLAKQLLALAKYLGRRDQAGIVLEPRLTHQMLADMLGLRRETVTLHLSHLVDAGAVETRSGQLVIYRSALLRVLREDGRRSAEDRLASAGLSLNPNS